MTGDGYVKLLRSIWADPDFVGLPSSAQRTYLMLLSQPNLTMAGVMPVTLARWAGLSTDTKPGDIAADIETLAAARFVIHDETTDEICVRSYARVDRAWTSPKGMTGLVRSIVKVLSLPIREAIRADLHAHGARVPIDPSEGASKGASKGVPDPQLASEPGEPDKPAAASEPARPPGDNSPTFASLPDDAAAALITSFIEARMAKGNVRNAGGLTRKIRKDIAARVRAHPDVTMQQLAVDECGIDAPKARAIIDPQADPDAECFDCEGTGWVNVAAEGKPASYARCGCSKRGAA